MHLGWLPATPLVTNGCFTTSLRQTVALLLVLWHTVALLLALWHTVALLLHCGKRLLYYFIAAKGCFTTCTVAHGCFTTSLCYDVTHICRHLQKEGISAVRAHQGAHCLFSGLMAVRCASLSSSYPPLATNWPGTVRVFERNFALEDAIGSHACSLEASTRVTNAIPLGWSLSYRLPLQFRFKH
jgi:hypothetical protein